MLALVRANCVQKNVPIELKAVKARLKNSVMQTIYLKRWRPAGRENGLRYNTQVLRSSVDVSQ